MSSSLPSSSSSSTDPPTPLPDERYYPLMAGTRLKMFRALMDHDSYYELSLEVSRYALELEDEGKQHIKGTTSASTIIKLDRSNKRRLATLLHSIPKTLMESVIKGSVAYDFLNPTANKSLNHYSENGAGTYVAGIAIEGRQGHFLSAAEMGKLNAHLLKYLEAYDQQCDLKGRQPTTTDEQGLDQWARDVDMEFGKRPYPDQLRFVTSDFSRAHLYRLQDSFRRRIRQSPDEKAFHRQSPLMIGCSNNLKKRMRAHLPTDTASSLSHSTPTWCLVLSLIKMQLKLDPKVVILPLVHIWDPDDLETSEVLGSALANSYVYQDGFNIIAGGGQAFNKNKDDDDHFEQSKKEVFETHNFLVNNIDATLEELERREELNQDISTIERFEMSNVDQEISILNLKHKEMQETFDEFGRLLDEMERIKKDVEHADALASRRLYYLQHAKKIVQTIIEHSK